MCTWCQISLVYPSIIEIVYFTLTHFKKLKLVPRAIDNFPYLINEILVVKQLEPRKKTPHK